MHRLLVFLALLLLALPSAARAERLALVIGNGAYGAIGALPNPANDARLIADGLRGAGFEVTLLTEADQRAMKGAIVAFGRRLRGAGAGATALFYFAGHGVQARGVNFLLPVGVNIRDEADLDIEAVEANWVLGQMESAGNTTNIMILDACRNNPFARSFRSVERGLAPMDAPTGSFIAQATAPGGVAEDGSGGNSPYSAALARAMRVPGLPIEQMFKQVRIDVLAATGGRQVPWDSSSLTGDFYFRPPPGAAQAGILLPPRPAPVQPVRPGPQTAPAQLRPAMIAPAPAAPPAGAIRAKLTTEYSRDGWQCNQGDFDPVTLALDAAPVRISAGGLRGLSFDMRAMRKGPGATIRLTLAGPNASREPIEIDLAGLAPGSRATAYSSLRDPERVDCGVLSAYLEIVD